ncbi:MAG: DUF805 domain-containing protein [Muribaculaceae bacterium]|nr:DUF805 domain-containing protein [Muribaculaceae bacterium]
MAKSVKSSVKKSVKQSGAPTSVKYTNMFAAYRAFWTRGYTEWAGTSSCSEYWWAALANALVIMILIGFYWWMASIVVTNIDLFALFAVSSGIGLLYCLAALIPSISMINRRLHDGGFSSWWMLLYVAGFIPYIKYPAGIVMLVLMLMPTKVENNPYHGFNK